MKFVAKSRIIRSSAVVERAQKNADGKAPAGTVFYAKPVLVSGKFWPTREEWEANRTTDASVDSSEGEAKVASQTIGSEAKAAEAVAQDPELQAIIKRFEKRAQQQ